MVAPVAGQITNMYSVFTRSCIGELSCGQGCRKLGFTLAGLGSRDGGAFGFCCIEGQGEERRYQTGFSGNCAIDFFTDCGHERVEPVPITEILRCLGQPYFRAAKVFSERGRFLQGRGGVLKLSGKEQKLAMIEI